MQLNYNQLVDQLTLMLATLQIPYRYRSQQARCAAAAAAAARLPW